MFFQISDSILCISVVFFQKSGSVFLHFSSVFSKIWQHFLNDGSVFCISVVFKKKFFFGSVYPLFILILRGALAHNTSESSQEF